MVDDIKILANSKEVRDNVGNLFHDIIKAFRGDADAAKEIFDTVGCAKNNVSDILMVEKLQMYWENSFNDPNEVIKLSSKIAESEDDTDCYFRIISAIDKFSSEKKTKYLANATRALLCNQIQKEEFFRLAKCLENILEEDIEYIKKYHDKEDLEYSYSAFELNNLGIMYISVIGNEERFSFTPLGKLFYDIVIKYDEE